MLYKKQLAVTALLAIATLARAQQPIPQCYTSEHHAELLKQYPHIAEIEQDFNAQMDRAARLYRTTTTDTTTYDIPIVVHIVHDYGQENITDNFIYDLVKTWTIHYTKQNADTASVVAPFVPWIGNAKIRFHLATKDPMGNPTKGITRMQSNWTNTAYDRSKFDQWPQNKYMNIWIVKDIYNPGVAAYSMFPADAVSQPYYDGIISMASQLTANPMLMQHELGHSFNLQHLWGNNNIGVACGDDLVDDTPPTKGHNFVCDLNDTACATGYMVHYVGAGGADSLVDYPDTTNTQNIMEYANCAVMFTKGQATRMRATLNSPVAGRNNLISAANLAATGALAPMPDLPPVADFFVTHPTSLLPKDRRFFMTMNNATPFAFRNASWNDTVTSVTWSFSNGAQAATSTAVLGIVANRFSVPGWATVSVTATSNAGSSTRTDTQAVYIADTITTKVSSGYIQDFTSAAAMANWPIFNYYHNRFNWSLFTTAGVGDNTCLRYSSYDATSRITDDPWHDVDDFFSPAFDLTDDSSGQQLFLNFYTAASSSPFASPGTESFVIEMSSDGGANWTTWQTITGIDLLNNGDQGDNFVPTLPSHWKARSYPIGSFYRKSRVFFRFRYNPLFNSNNFYIDRIMLSRHAVDVDRVLPVGQQFSIYPNPANNGFTLSFNTGTTGDVNYTIRDITGKLVYEHKANLAPNTTQQETIGRDVTQVAGMYLITVSIDGNSSTQKLVVY